MQLAACMVGNVRMPTDDKNITTASANSGHSICTVRVPVLPRVRVCACVRACVGACVRGAWCVVRACVRACVCMCVCRKSKSDLRFQTADRRKTELKTSPAPLSD